MNPLLWWAQFWAAFWVGMLRRPSAEIYHLDDYRPDNDKKPNGRAA